MVNSPSKTSGSKLQFRGQLSSRFYDGIGVFFCLDAEFFTRDTHRNVLWTNFIFISLHKIRTVFSFTNRKRWTGISRFSFALHLPFKYTYSWFSRIWLFPGAAGGSGSGLVAELALTSPKIPGLSMHYDRIVKPGPCFQHSAERGGLFLLQREREPDVQHARQ